MKMTLNHNPKGGTLLLILTVLLGIFGALGYFATASGEEQMEGFMPKFPPREIPKPQPFCGYCHILTYPNVVQKGFELWKKGKHNQVGCVECHYPPPKKKAEESPTEASGADLLEKHIPKKPPEYFSFIELDNKIVTTKPRIADASCMTANCHGRPEDDFKTKKIQFTKKVSFVHQTHLDNKNQIEGMVLNCTNCHQHETDRKKFEVTETSCHVCHFTNTKFNEGRARCDLCHDLPQKPIQTSGDKPITHEILKEAKVSCTSCHIEVIQAIGGGQYEAFYENGELKTAMILGAGRIKEGNCFVCHDEAKDLKEAKNKKLMHERHVTIKNARCLDCHQPIAHAKADKERPAPGDRAGSELKQAAHDRIVWEGCAACHPEPHRYQGLLAAGLKREGVLSSPDPMHRARTNCFGCHTEKGLTDKGAKVLKASGRTCVACHTKDHDKMLKDWKKELAGEIEYAKEVEKEALEALAASKPKLSKEALAETMTMLEEGQENLNIVRYGNGVHNKKYSIMLIDAAITRFEDMIDYIDDNKQ